MSATTTTSVGAWTGVSPPALAMDPPSGSMYGPASQYIAFPHRVSGVQFSTQPVSQNLATDSPGLARPRRTRASKPKVRTGCSTCKIRRIKCDEAKPSCERCTSTGRKCDGYEFPKKADQQELKRTPSVLSPPTKRPTLVPVYTNIVLPTSLSQPFEGTLQEKRLFHRFQVRTVPSFSGGSEANFWTRVVLRAGQREPIVRNAIIALGALHEDYQIRSGKYDTQLIEDQSYREVTLLYGKALRQLNERLNAPTQENAKIAIICSILFTCFEVLRRNNMAAVVHYQQGMRHLMRQMALPTPSPSPTDTDPNTSTLTTSSNNNQPQSLTVRFREIPEDELDDMMRVFARYDIQACTFSKERAETLHVDTTSPRSVPALTELTLPQVRTHLDNLLICVYQLIKSDLRMYRYWDLSSVPPLWQQRRTSAIQVFEDWSAALDQFLSTAETTLPPHEAKSLLGLRLQIHVAIMELKMAIDHKPETCYDGFRPEFCGMVSRVEKLFGILSLHDAKPLDVETVDFTMELGLIHPLFFIAVKCRDWNIRRRAVALLRKAGKEGVWEGPIMAVLATKIMRLEEQGCARGTLVPERNRFHEVKKNVDYDGRRVLFEMSKPLGGGWDNWHVLRGEVTF